MSEQPSDAPTSRARPHRGVVLAVVLGLVGLAAVLAVVLLSGDEEASGCDEYATLLERIEAGEQEGQSEETIADLGDIAARSEESDDAAVREAAATLASDVEEFQTVASSDTLAQSISALAEACGLDPAPIFVPPDV
jgi:hypothetical protein